MKRAGLVDAPERALSVLTEGGRELLHESDAAVDSNVLRRFSEFRNFKDPEPARSLPVQPEAFSSEGDLSPDDAMDRSFLNLRQATIDELLDLIQQRSPRFFEHLVVQLLERMGHGGYRGAAETIGGGRDGGVDGLIWEDELRLDAVYVQDKRWSEKPVGRPDVQGFVGSLDGFRARKGVFITTSRFSSEAYEYVNQIDKRVALVDCQRLGELMYDVGLGVSGATTYSVKSVDSDFFEAED